MAGNDNVRNIGIFAHVDSGKTTLTEQMLTLSGVLRVPGSVDRGTACTDSLPVEKRRGISVRAACVELNWQGTKIRLIDTPGHTDFSAEIERSFWALDGAVLLLDAAEGLQPQTAVLFRALQKQQLPCLFFINKTDRTGADPEGVMQTIRRRLSPHAVDLNDEEALLEAACEESDLLAGRFLEGKTISREECLFCIPPAVKAARLFPVLRGSGLKGDGVAELLNSLVLLLPSPLSRPDPLCAVAFSSCRDKAMGRGLWVRVFSGSLRNRMALELPSGEDPGTGQPRMIQKKITRLRDARSQDAEMLESGDIGTVYGLGDTPIGHVFGDASLLPRHVEPGSFRSPLITVKVIPEKEEERASLQSACYELSLEDPLLQAEHTPAGEIHLHAMGKVQLEILQELLSTRYGIQARFGEPAVILRETIAAPATGFVAYTMPKPCWAVMEFYIEPAPRGSGITFVSNVSKEDIPLRYQHQVKQAIPTALRQGRMGWEVTDVKITLTGGNYHPIHTHPLDFILATPMGIHDGLRRGGTKLLEPLLNISFLVPSACGGRVMSDITRMRGETLSMTGDGETALIKARVPVSTSLDYSVTLAALTGGRGSMSTTLSGYRELPENESRVFPRLGIDPLDSAKYILAARSALEGSVYD